MDNSERLLFQPCKVRGLQLKNRLVMTGHGMRFPEGGMPGDRLRRYVAERARGGAGLVILESAPVAPESAFYDQEIHVWKESVIPFYRRLAKDVHAAGARVFQILWHAGHNGRPYMSYLPTVAPSAVPDLAGGCVPKVLDHEDLRRIVRAYAQAARNVKEGGLDGAEIQTAADYLLGSFLSPALNQRTDEYGGSLQNRLRFVLEVLTAVREAVGDDFVVGIRTSGDHAMPSGDGLGLEDAKEIVHALSTSGLIDYVSIITGSFYSAPTLVPPMAIPRGHAVPLAQAIRPFCPLPIIITGRIRSPGQAEDILRDGHADLIGMARSFVADPEWAAKAERGEANRIRPCMSCNQGCWGMVVKGRTGTCVINPVAGNEQQLGRRLSRARPRKKVLVVGGGPAGMEAARVAALRGHSVELHEQSPALGGQMRLAVMVPERAEMAEYIRWAEDELGLLGVDVRLNSPVTPEQILAGAWDAVVLATGARPSQAGFRRLIPTWTGLPIQGMPVFSSWQAVESPDKVGAKVLFVDEEHRHGAASTVQLLAGTGHQVTVVTSAQVFGFPELHHTMEFPLLYPRLLSLGVRFLTAQVVYAVEEGFAQVLHLFTSHTERIGPFDTLVLATGSDPETTLYDALRERAPHVLRIGDCVSPRGLMLSTYEGHVAGRSL